MFRSLKIYIVILTCFGMRVAKILKEKSREYKGTAYYKFKVNIPSSILEDSGLSAGDDVELIASKGEVKIKKVVK